MPNWKTIEAKDRLLAALVAAHPDKKLLDYRRIATYYGQGTTYDSIEGQFRVIRKAAQKLREAVESGEHVPAPPRGASNGGGGVTIATGNGISTPRAAKDAANATTPKARTGTSAKSKRTDGVLSGRVTKSNSPPKARKNALAPAAAAAATSMLAAHFIGDENGVSDPAALGGIDGTKDDVFSSQSSAVEVNVDDFAIDEPDWNVFDVTYP